MSCTLLCPFLPFPLCCRPPFHLFFFPISPLRPLTDFGGKLWAKWAKFRDLHIGLNAICKFYTDFIFKKPKLNNPGIHSSHIEHACICTGAEIWGGSDWCLCKWVREMLDRLRVADLSEVLLQCDRNDFLRLLTMCSFCFTISSSTSRSDPVVDDV